MFSLDDLDVAPPPVVPPAKIYPPIHCLLLDESRQEEMNSWKLAMNLLDTSVDTVDTCSYVLVFSSYKQLLQLQTKAKIVYVWNPNEENNLSTVHHKKVFENWIYPQSNHFAPIINILTEGSPVRVMPQIWGPESMPEIVYNCQEKDNSEGTDIVIVSDHVSSTSLVFPLLACELVEAHNPKYIKNVIVISSTPFESKDYESLLIQPKIKYVVCKADDIVPYFSKRKQYSVFLYHQMNTTANPALLWKLVYTGFPLVHNLKTSLQVGIKYVDNEVHKAAKFVTVAKESFVQAYVDRNRQSLLSLHPLNDTTKDIVKKTLDEWTKPV